MSGILHGQVALVTGGSRGIGRGVAVRLGAEGAHVVVNCVHNREAADDTVRMITDAGGTAEVVPFDVADAEAVVAATEALLERTGRCDILVNNAGITKDTLILRMKETDWDRVMAVNLRGVFSCSKAIARTMLKARYGRIVNMTSVIGAMGNSGQVAYGAAKAGIVGLTKSLARELASRNITVNAVAPGFIDTEMVANLPDSARSEYLKLIPVGRLGTVDEVADAVAFLVRPAAAYVTGQVIGVNGGLYM